MPNTISNRTLCGGIESPKVVKHIHIISDGTQETDYLVFDASQFWSDPTAGSVVDVKAGGSVCICRLEWDATADSPIVSVNPTSDFKLNFKEFGGISNPGGAGATGDILLTTTGLTAGAEVTLVITIKR